MHGRSVPTFVDRTLLMFASVIAFCVMNLAAPQTRLRIVGDRAFCVAAAKTWNSLPSEVTSSATLSTFKLKTYLFHFHFPHVISPHFPHVDCNTAALVDSGAGTNLKMGALIRRKAP